MIGSDYIAIFVLNLSRQSAGKRPKYVFTTAEIEAEVKTALSWARYPTLPKDIHIAIGNLIDCGVAVEIVTPHAKPRYAIEYRRENFSADEWPFTGGLEEVARAHSDLGDEWLLESILGVTDADNATAFELEPSPDRSWSPLPLDRPDPELDRVVETFDQLAEQVRADNGYAAEHSGERDDVVTRLKAAGEYLRQATTITRSGVETYVVWPLRTLVVRFGPSAIGAATKLAWGLFSAWLKQKLGL